MDTFYFYELKYQICQKKLHNCIEMNDQEQRLPLRSFLLEMTHLCAHLILYLSVWYLRYNSSHCIEHSAIFKQCQLQDLWSLYWKETESLVWHLKATSSLQQFESHLNVCCSRFFVFLSVCKQVKSPCDKIKSLTDVASSEKHGRNCG